MTWPQRFPDRPSGSQFGWRTFQGKQTFHYGRDQPAGVGAIHRAHADGKVLVHGHDRVYGFYLVVEYNGAPGVRHHIHQLQDRGRALGASNFKKGDQLGLVGDPLLNVPVSQRFNHATYCGSTFSTGPHSHEEVRTATQIEAAIDPAGTQASNIWKTIEANQASPAGGGSQPIGDDFLATMNDAEKKLLLDAAHAALGSRDRIGGMSTTMTLTDFDRNTRDSLVRIEALADGTRSIVGGSTADNNGDGLQDEQGLVNRLRSVESKLNQILAKLG